LWRAHASGSPMGLLAADAADDFAADATGADASIDAVARPDGPSARGSIVVYSGTSTGPIKYGGIGWVYGLSELSTIDDAMISGLGHPQYSGQMAPGGAQHVEGDALKVAPQLKRAGGLGVSIYVQDYYSAWPYQNDGVDSYMANVVDKVTAAVKADPNRAFFHYVPFNEPDWIWYGPSGSKLTQLMNDWKKVYARIKTADPAAKIAGPNFERYNAAAYDAFFSFAKTNGCLPDITTWHDLDDGAVSYYASYASYRAIETKYAIPAREVFINEYGRSAGEMGRPGRVMRYLARFEKTKVYGGMAAWGAIGRLCDLLAADRRPTGGWYLYQWYGQSAGHTVDVALPDDNGPLQAMAFRDDAGPVRVIFGGSANDGDVYNLDVVVTDLPGASARYQVFETGYTAEYQAPPAVRDAGTAAVTGGHATIAVTGCKALSAYLVVVSP
jgi:hypothetical protein